jgi:hypothetical protein
MKDALSTEAARLAAEQGRILGDRDIAPHDKQEQIGKLQERINAIIQTRRVQNAQRVNRVSPMEQRERRY